MSNIWPWSATRMLNLSATATLRICATPDSKHVKETHLDQTVLVSARGTNRNTIQPLGQLEASCQDTTKKIPQQKAKSAYGMYSWTNTPIHKSCWLRQGEPNEAFQLPAGYLKWLGVEPQWHFSDTLSILAQRHMSGPGVMGCWTSQTMQNAAVCFEEGHQNRCCNLRAEGSCFKCVNPMWRSDCSSVPVSNQVPPFARQSLVAKWKWAACSFPESKQIEGPRGPSKQYAAKVWIYALWSIPDLLPEVPNLSAPTDTKNMCHCGFQACQRDKNWIKLQASTPLFISQNPTSGRGQLMLSSFLKLLLFPTCPTTISKMSVPRTTIFIKAHSTLTKTSNFRWVLWP